MRYFTKLLATIVVAGFFIQGAMAAEKVSLGVPSWTGAKAIATLVGVIVTDRIGGEVNYVPGNNATIYQAMDKGRGDIDVHPDVWLPNQSSFTDNYVTDKGTVTLSQKNYTGADGFCVPKAFSDKHNVKDVTDLGRPDVAAKMDSDGDGKGEIWVGAPGWASTRTFEVKVRDYGLLAFQEAVQADEAVRTARIKDAVNKGEGFAFYCYRPHSLWAQFDLVLLNEPDFDPSKYKMVQPDQSTNWYEESYVATRDKPKQVQIAYSTSLKKRSPAIADLLANLHLSADDVSKLTFEIDNGGDAEDVVRKWIKNNSSRVDGWLGL